jgi:hypothetical protein
MIYTAKKDPLDDAIPLEEAIHDDGDDLDDDEDDCFELLDDEDLDEDLDDDDDDDDDEDEDEDLDEDDEDDDEDRECRGAGGSSQLDHALVRGSWR